MQSTQDTLTPSDATVAKQTAFKVGWSYDVFLRKNGLPPSEAAVTEWRELSRSASKAQLDSMHELSARGAKTVCKIKAVYNAKDGRFDTSLTARVIQPGCNDAELITDAIIRAQDRASKRLSDMRQVASQMGVIGR